MNTDTPDTNSLSWNVAVLLQHQTPWIGSTPGVRVIDRDLGGFVDYGVAVVVDEGYDKETAAWMCEYWQRRLDRVVQILLESGEAY